MRERQAGADEVDAEARQEARTQREPTILKVKIVASLAVSAIKTLMGLAPKTARVVQAEAEIDIPIKQLAAGDIVRVRPGEKISVDGIIVDGHSQSTRAC